ncbi:MAG: cation transporter [Acidobacteria bacterium]|nr:cation transporter [Acidobacteriota bacterium]
MAHLHGPGTPGRLALSSVLFGVNFLFQALGGLWTGSLGLVSDSVENLNDAVVNLLAMGTIHLANRREPCDRYAYGWHRLEILQTLLGVLLLLGLAGAILWEGFRRLAAPKEILVGWAIGFSGLGLLLNLGATFVLLPRRGSHLESDLNLRGAYLHALGDSVANLGVLLSMVLIRITGWRWLDPVVAMAIAVFILRGAYLLARDAFGILMHRAAFDHGAAKARLLAIPGIVGVEDLRSWRACSHLTVCTAHVVVAAERLEETRPFLERIEDLMTREFGVRHMTVHFETAAMSGGHHHRFVHRHEDGHGH